MVQSGQTGRQRQLQSGPVDQPAANVLTTKNDMNLVHHLAASPTSCRTSENARENSNHGSHDVRMPTPSVTSRGAGSMVSPTIARAGGPGEALEEEDAETAVGQAGYSAQAVLEQAFRENVDPQAGSVLINGHVPHLLDIRFRMLQNSELARAMASMTTRRQYEFAGNMRRGDEADRQRRARPPGGPPWWGRSSRGRTPETPEKIPSEPAQRDTRLENTEQRDPEQRDPEKREFRERFQEAR